MWKSPMRASSAASAKSHAPAADHDHAARRIGLGAGERAVEGLQELEVVRVFRLRSIQPDRRDGAIGLILQGIWH